MKLEELLMNEEIVAKLDEAKDTEELRAILLENGADEEEAGQFIEQLIAQSKEGELSEDELEDVAGGGLIHRCLFRFVYRIKHGKLFVKATEDKDKHVITVVNRFGKKVEEVYDIY